MTFLRFPLTNALFLILGVFLSCLQVAHAVSPRVIGGSFARLVPQLDRFVTLAPLEDDIARWADIAMKAGGTKIVRQELGQRNLPQELLDDTFLRILVRQKRMQPSEAEAFFRTLHGIPGFGSALSKSMGASPAGTLGHLTEVRMAHQAIQKNFKVHGIGVRFSDPNKKADTDIDLVLEKRDALIAIEAKAYPPDAFIPLDTFRADMLTLQVHAQSHAPRKVVSFFWITSKPIRESDWKAMEAFAQQHNVELIAASPENGIHWVNQICCFAEAIQ